MEKSTKKTVVSAVWIFGLVLLVTSVILFIISIAAHNQSLRVPSIILSVVATILGLVRAIIR